MSRKNIEFERKRALILLRDKINLLSQNLTAEDLNLFSQAVTITNAGQKEAITPEMKEAVLKIKRVGLLDLIKDLKRLTPPNKRKDFERQAMLEAQQWQKENSNDQGT